MVRTGAFLLAIAASPPSIAAAATPPAAPAERNPTVAERAWVAASIYRTVKQYFAHWDGLPASYDFEARFRAYLPEALAAPDRRGFSLATLRLVASLQNGHTSFRDEALFGDRRPMPVYAEPIEGRWTVTASRTAAVPLGSVVVAVDDAPVESWVAPIRAVIGQSSPAARDQVVFHRRFMFPAHFTLTLEDGRRVRVDRDGPFGPPQGRAPAGQVAVLRRPDGVVVIAIPSFADPSFETAAVAAVRSAKGARLVVLDVRGNDGGSTPDALLKAVMTRPYAGTLVATPLSIAENDARGSYSPEDNPTPKAVVRYGPETTPPDPAAHAGPMALLIDRRCASACEDFAIRFQSGHRGPVLGEPSWGSTGQPYQASFPDLAMTLRVSTKRESLPDGRPFEGVGVQPDIPTPTTRADIAAATDTVLERAVSLVLSPSTAAR